MFGNSSYTKLDLTKLTQDW